MTTKKYLLLAFFLLAAPAALYAGRPMGPFEGAALSLGSGDVPAPSPSAQAKPSTHAKPSPQLRFPLPAKKYTLMLFMNGKNNLGVFMARKLMELEKVGSDANINIVAEVGLMAREPVCSTCPAVFMYGSDWTGTRRFYVQRNPDRNAVKMAASLRLPSPESADMGDYQYLAQFITWTKTNFPAEKYIVVVGNHGGAWVDKQRVAAAAPVAPPAKGVSYDDVTGNYIATPEIGMALRAAGGADVLVFDDCLMQAAEVAAEVGGSAKYILGSEEISYTNHFRADLLFSPLKANPNMSPAGFTDMFMRTYSAYNGAMWNAVKKYPGTLSALDTSKIGGLEAAVKKYALAARAVEGPEARLAYKDAMREVIRYNYVYCADLYDFVELVQRKIAAKIAEGKIPESQATRDLGLAAEELKGSITGQLVMDNFTFGNLNGVEYSRSHGVSVYIPSIRPPAAGETQTVFLIAPGTLATKYTDLEFDKATGWSLFVKYLIGH